MSQQEMDQQEPSAHGVNPPAGDGNTIAEQFYAGAIRRILKLLVVLPIVLAAPVWWFCGPSCALGFVAGAAVSWLNFQSLARGVEGLGDRIALTHSSERGGVVVARFLLRYLLVGMVAYVIFNSSPKAFPGFLYGLCLPVAAMLCEAAYEVYGALRRGY